MYLQDFICGRFALGGNILAKKDALPIWKKKKKINTTQHEKKVPAIKPINEFPDI